MVILRCQFYMVILRCQFTWTLTKRTEKKLDGNCTIIGLVLLFNEEQKWYYLTHSWEDKGVHTFPKGICPKVNVIARLEYELAYYDSAVHRFNHYTTKTPLCIIMLWALLNISWKQHPTKLHLYGHQLPISKPST